jgi:hypothetical protein
VLIAVAVVGLKPWAPSSVVPSVAFPAEPNRKAGVADSVALPPRKVSAVADSSAVRRPASKLAAERHLAHAGQREPPAAGTPTVAVSVAQPVSAVGGSEPTPPESPSPAPEAEPVVAPGPEAPAPPAAAPLAGEAGGGGGRSPVTAGVGSGTHSCEGGEYVLVVTPEGAGSAGEPPQLEIKIEYFGADGSGDEFSLQGDEEDVRELVQLLSAQGACVRVEEVSAEGPVEPVAEEPEAGAGTARVDEALDLDLP